MSKEGCSCCRVLSMGVTLAIIGAGGYAAWFFLGQPSGDEVLDIAKDIGDKVKNIDFGDLTGALENFTGFSPDLWNEDPFVGDNTTNLWSGNTNGNGGLYLELWNALDDSWQTEYAEAVNDWNTLCDPKVLVLTTKVVPVDNECSQADGVMKVCNGNYGETGWLGINEILKSVPAGIIQSSVAKMNEHYLLNADYDERLYTMCHELGHGYGLPHTDENFNNKDLENCLDYTNSPQNNLRPGDANCDRLLGMYGAVDGGRQLKANRRSRSRRRISQQQAQRTLRYRSDAEIYEDEMDEYEVQVEDMDIDMDMDMNKDTDTDDDGRYYYEYARSQHPDMTAEYQKAMEELYYDISEGNILQQQQEHEPLIGEEQLEEEDEIQTIDVSEKRGKWRCLREHPRGGDFVRKLNDGFVLEVHVLYPSAEQQQRQNNNKL